MAPNHLTSGEMSNIVARWTGRDRARLEAVPWLAALLDPLDRLAAAFLADQTDPEAERREAVAAFATASARFDADVAALDDLLTGLAAWQRDPADRAALERARAAVLPAGRALINLPTLDKVALVDALARIVGAEARATLERHTIDGRTLWALVRETFTADARTLRQAYNRRLRFDDRPSRRRRGFNRATRSQFMRILDLMRRQFALHGSDPALYQAVLHIPDLTIAAATRRAKARGAAGEAGEGEVDEAGAAAGADAASPGAPAAETAPGDAGDTAPASVSAVSEAVQGAPVAAAAADDAGEGARGRAEAVDRSLPGADADALHAGSVLEEVIDETELSRAAAVGAAAAAATAATAVAGGRGGAAVAAAHAEGDDGAAVDEAGRGAPE